MAQPDFTAHMKQPKPKVELTGGQKLLCKLGVDLAVLVAGIVLAIWGYHGTLGYVGPNYAHVLTPQRNQGWHICEIFVGMIMGMAAAGFAIDALKKWWHDQVD